MRDGEIVVTAADARAVEVGPPLLFRDIKKGSTLAWQAMAVPLWPSGHVTGRDGAETQIAESHEGVATGAWDDHVPVTQVTVSAEHAAPETVCSAPIAGRI